ncbi:DUF4143 domain-containing protein [Niabella hibiscisoli]|nr:DUF4143 domain-containing protein [Niabella hibiscisoli]MCH5721139.1 DUF4143 domain-containing protein [Niabella hibiscisoli]
MNERTDTGALWENYIISERIKMLSNQEKEADHYFWRTTQQQEIDLIEETADRMSAYEFKWSKNARARFSSTFTTNYPGTDGTVITPDNMEDFLIPE